MTKVLFLDGRLGTRIWNLGQNIWHKLNKYNKIGQDFKNIISTFACFFDSNYQRLISGRNTGH